MAMLRMSVAAIVLSGGYEDDLDSGDEIIYTGAGGNDGEGKQIEDQRWEKSDNKGLLIRYGSGGLPVRVIRGYKHRSEIFAENRVILMLVCIVWWMPGRETGKSGFIICRVRLEYSGQNPERNTPERIELKYSNKRTERKGKYGFAEL